MIPREALLERIHVLPTLPLAAARLGQLLGDDRATLSAYEEVLRPDPALTANLLRLVNSPYFAVRRTIKTVREAVLMLGSQRVFELAACVGFGNVVPSTITGYDMNAQSFWQHSVAVAVISERLAEELDLRGVSDMLFTAGLLHDVGKLAIGVFLTGGFDDIEEKLADGLTDLALAEREILGFDHADAGADMADHWKLPAELVHPIRHHHAPSRVEDPAAQPVVDVVHIADALAHTMGFSGDAGGLARRVDSAVVERIAVKVSRLERVASVAVDSICELSKFLNQDSMRDET